MRCIVSRIKNSELYIDGRLFSKTGQGLLVYVGIKIGDSKETADKMINKLLKLRIFSDENGKLNKSVTDINGEIMLISNFTVYGNAIGGNRPDFIAAEKGSLAEPLYGYMLNSLKEKVRTSNGVFGAYMQIINVNDGPVNIIIEY